MILRNSWRFFWSLLNAFRLEFYAISQQKRIQKQAQFSEFFSLSLNSCFMGLSICVCSVFGLSLLVYVSGIEIIQIYGRFWNRNWKVVKSRRLLAGRRVLIGSWIFIMIEKSRICWLILEISQASQTMNRSLVLEIFQCWFERSNNTKLQ